MPLSEYIKKWLQRLFWLAVPLSIVWALILKYLCGLNGADALHQAIYYWPGIGLLAIISGEIDLLKSIEQGEKVNIPARGLNLAHWLLLMGLNIGSWQANTVSISWFGLKLVLVGIIGWQIGIGLNRQWRPTMQDKIAGLIGLLSCVVAGLTLGYLRTLDESPFGWGWILESVTAFGATLIVWNWIMADLKTIAVNFRGYNRAFFWKGMFSNALILGFCTHLVLQEGGFTLPVLLRNNGLAFNVTVGNVLFWVFYGTYEHYRHQQEQTKT